MIKKNIKWFILILLFSILAWLIVFDFSEKTKDYEEISIFITASNFNKKHFDSCFSDLDIKEHHYYSYSYDDPIYATCLETQGFISSDILIIKKESMDSIEENFAPISSEFLQGLDLDEENLLINNGICYGIKLTDELKIVVNNYIKLNDGDFYIVINRATPNCGEYSNAKSKVKTNNSFLFLEKLLKND